MIPPTISDEQIIENIKSAHSLKDVVTDINNYKDDVDSILMSIHPDKCKLSGASDATAKLLGLRAYHEKGCSFNDESGSFKTNGYWLSFDGSDKKILQWSYENFLMLKDRAKGEYAHFDKYLPQSARFENGILTFSFENRSIPLVKKELPQIHVNWILNRMLEFSAWMSEIGIVHCGLNPDNVFIVPETHGIQVTSFYHMTKSGGKVGTISAKYQTWYPPQLFTDKIAADTIDLELSQKTAIYLLGDISGTGIKLRKTHLDPFIDFVINQHAGAYETLVQYKELLQKNFKKEFFVLNI